MSSPSSDVPGWRKISVTVAAIAFVANLTLRPAPYDTLLPVSPFACLLGCGDESVRDLISNILLFIPLGWALRHWLAHRSTLAVCLLATVIIETLQATVIPGRDSSLRDVLSNTAGGALGAWLFAHWRTLAWPHGALSGRLGTLAAAGWTGVLTATAFGVQLAPASEPWFGHWAPELAFYQRFPGRLVSAEVDGWSPPDGPIPDARPLRDAMGRDSFRLQMEIITGPKPAGRSLIFAVMDQRAQPQVLVGQQRSAIWLTWRDRFEAWELRGMTLRIPIFPGSAPGNSVAIETGRSAGSIVLRAASGTSVQEVRVPQTVGLGWTSMLPFHFAISDEWAVFNPIWLAGLALPMAYWFGRASTGLGLLATLSLVFVGLLLIPLTTGATPTTAPEWIGGLAGGLLGWTIGGVSRRGSPHVATP